MEGDRRRFASKAALLGLAAACLVALFPGGSQAATGGLVYPVSKLKPLPAGKQATASAVCPKDTSVVGGGIEIDGANTATGMQSSYPFDGGDADLVPDDGWRGIANSRSAGDKSMLSFAVCSQTGRYRYITRVKDPVANNSQAQVEAPCPPGRLVAGGGVKLSFGGSNTTSYIAAGTVPYDLTGNGTMDGWRAVANNQSGINQDLTAYAICASTGTYRYPLTQVNVASGQRTVDAHCPRQFSVTAGGVQANTLDLRAEVAASLPFDGGDADMVRDDWWRGAINNNSPFNAELRTYAVCRKIA
jgi:hypothetical protein